MDFNRTWTRFAVDAEIDYYGSERIVRAHNDARARIAELTARVAELEAQLARALQPINPHIPDQAFRYLTTRVAELEAERAGETGTPKAEGRYWCETIGMAPERWWCLLWWDDGQWQYQHDCSWTPVKSSVRVTRFHRLPGETYTEIPR